MIRLHFTKALENIQELVLKYTYSLTLHMHPLSNFLQDMRYPGLLVSQAYVPQQAVKIPVHVHNQSTLSHQPWWLIGLI